MDTKDTTVVQKIAKKEDEDEESVAINPRSIKGANDETTLIYLKASIKTMNKSFGLCEPMGDHRSKTLKAMFHSIFLERQNMRFCWPRGRKLEEETKQQGQDYKYDYGKSTTIQLFLYMWIKCGITDKSIRVEFTNPTIANSVMEDLMKKASKDPDCHLRILKCDSQVIYFSTAEDVEKHNKRELLVGGKYGRIYIGHAVKGGSVGVDTDIVICEETGFENFDKNAKTGPIKFLFHSTPMYW